MHAPRHWKPIAIIGAGVAAAGGVTAARVIGGYADPWKAPVAAAGFTLRTARIGDVDFSYAEGPDNGPPLVLLHAQHMDWFSYSRVLPALAGRFHVFDIDYPGPARPPCPGITR